MQKEPSIYKTTKQTTCSCQTTGPLTITDPLAVSGYAPLWPLVPWWRNQRPPCRWYIGRRPRGRGRPGQSTRHKKYTKNGDHELQPQDIAGFLLGFTTSKKPPSIWRSTVLACGFFCLVLKGIRLSHYSNHPGRFMNWQCLQPMKGLRPTHAYPWGANCSLSWSHQKPSNTDVTHKVAWDHIRNPDSLAMFVDDSCKLGDSSLHLYQQN